jgi:hypothetical protein
MTVAFAEKPVSDERVSELYLELADLDSVLTEARYDEIVAVLLPHCQFADAAATMLSFGPKPWREKWGKVMREQDFIDSPKAKAAK